MSENHSLLPRTDCIRDEESSFEELSDNSSCDSYYSDSDSSIAEWESFLDNTGYLLYIDCHPFVKQSFPVENDKKESNFVKDKLRQSTRSKFLKLLRRRDSKRRSKRYRTQDSSQDSSTASKVTFQDHENGQIKIVNIHVNHDGRTAFGRRSTLIENLLGISISSFPNSTRVMIAGFTASTDSKNDRNIKIGDWLKMIQNIEVDINNINGILEQVANNETLVLHLQRVAAVEVTNQPPVSELHHQSKYVYHLLNYDEGFSEILCNMPIGVAFINTDNLSESDVEFKDIVYGYPKPFKQNIVCQIRGLFITLNHLLDDVTKSKPQISTFLYKNSLSHAVYATYDQYLLLLMLPDCATSKSEMKLVHTELLRILEFTYDSIVKCFENQAVHKQLDHFFALFFERMLNIGTLFSDDYKPTLGKRDDSPQFEDVLAGAPLMSLPNEIQIQIDDALTEMEASDYRDWNEEPLDCQRLFTILGSALYHKGYLLASHFMHEDLIDVHSYCRQNGFFYLLETETVRSLVHWREVFPSSSKKKLSATKFADERCYVLVIGRGKDLLAVIMEAGGSTEPPEENMGPDPFYVEEVEATLSHIQELGIQEFADRWIEKNATKYFEELENRTNQKTDFLAFGKSSISNRNSAFKKPEVTSILKRRSSDLQLSQSGSIFSLQDEEYSEDSTSQEGYSERSEMSDEPVVGRRVIRERRNVLGLEDGDSDIDDYREGSQLSGGSYDLSELRQALLSETESTQPVRITSGEQNVLYHYVEYDGFEGVLLLPPNAENSCVTFNNILDNFRVAAQNIRKLFENTLRFKNMTAQDMAKSLMNKTLIAIKEHGTLFECTHQSPQLKKPCKIAYWVIGRLFYMPYPREMYVCYQDSIPQNLIDMAFKLGVR